MKVVWGYWTVENDPLCAPYFTEWTDTVFIHLFEQSLRDAEATDQGCTANGSRLRVSHVLFETCQTVLI